MKHNGLTYRRNRAIGWRVARPETPDYYDNGKQITGWWPVVFRKTETGEQPIPMHAHISRSEVVGKAKVGVGKSYEGLRYTIGDNIGHEIMSGDIYTEQVHYLVEGNFVHQFTARRVAKHGDL
ncbi:unnamed protein product [marine sediment metagenome]|uniref:Uncharacterized protein n=1 Tax=marine sediment metagenome TaxID=412755 RepID=X0THL3_9ZZZZ